MINDTARGQCLSLLPTFNARSSATPACCNLMDNLSMLFARHSA